MRKVIGCTVDTYLRFGAMPLRNQFNATVTPGVEFYLEAPFLWVTWVGVCMGIPLSKVIVDAEIPGVKK